MDELVAFLSARLDEAGAAARAYVPVAGHTHRHAEGKGWREHNHMAGGLPHQHDPDSGFQVWAPRVGDPVRALREVEAKRRLIDIVLEYEAKIDSEWGCSHTAGEIAAGSCRMTPAHEIEAFRVLAAVDDGHPDYRQEWALEPSVDGTSRLGISAL